jgi:hypothetical protein
VDDGIGNSINQMKDWHESMLKHIDTYKKIMSKLLKTYTWISTTPNEIPYPYIDIKYKNGCARNCNVIIASDKCCCSFTKWYDTMKFLAPPMEFDWGTLNLLVGRSKLYYDN